METPLSPLDFVRRNAALIFACGSALFLSSCGLDHDRSDPISLVFPSPSQPHLVLTADRSEVRKGESVELVVTFVNPTKRRVVMPTTGFVGRDGIAAIEHRLEYGWNKESGDSSSGLSLHAIDRCPPSIDYLEPGQRKSYRLRWTSHYEVKGVVTLKYEFGWGKDFPPATLKLKTY